MSSRLPKTNFARAILSSAGDRMRGGRSIRSEVFSLIPLLRAMARVRTRNQTAADSLVEETLRLAVARRNQLQDGGNLTAWLLAIQRAIFASNSYDQGPPEPELDRESRANWRTLHGALLQLTDTLREALFLSDGAGYEYGEIAEVVGTDVGTVKWRAGEALCRLVELFEVRDSSEVTVHADFPLHTARALDAELLHPNRMGTNNLEDLLRYANENNISRYKRLLNETADENRRSILQALLSEEKSQRHQGPDAKISDAP